MTVSPAVVATRFTNDVLGKPASEVDLGVHGVDGAAAQEACALGLLEEGNGGYFVTERGLRHLREKLGG